MDVILGSALCVFFGKEEIDGLRWTSATVGYAEAEMFLRGVVPAYWSYEVLNLACSGGEGGDVVVSEICAWLETAGEKLKEEKPRSETSILRFTPPVPNCPSRENGVCRGNAGGILVEQSRGK